MIDNPCRRPLIHRDTLAAASAIYQGLESLQYTSKASLTNVSELHGNEDGTIPATFQIIYMVCNVLFSTLVTNFKRYVDRLETVIKSAQTAGSGRWKGQPERSLVEHIPLTRKIHCIGLDLHTFIGNLKIFIVFCPSSWFSQSFPGLLTPLPRPHRWTPLISHAFFLHRTCARAWHGSERLPNPSSRPI